jgi:hypothetical protein
MTNSVDAMIETWNEINAKNHQPNGKKHRSPTLRDAALVTAIARIIKVTMQRDIWM